jgi:hypothetical protein
MITLLWPAILLLLPLPWLLRRLPRRSRRSDRRCAHRSSGAGKACCNWR